METKANHVLIGTFVLSLLVAGFGFVYWLNNAGTGASSRTYAILFEGGVGGITNSSDVLFNGIRVGKVTRVSIYPKDTRKVEIIVKIAEIAPIRVNSRARIIQRGLAGLSAIQISPGTPDAEILTAPQGSKIAHIKADRAVSRPLFEAAPDVLSNADAAVNRINDILANNEDSIQRTVANIEAFTSVLAQNKGEIELVFKEIHALARKFDKVGDVMASADKLIGDINKVVSDNEVSLGATLKNMESFTDELDRNKGEISGIIADVKQVTTELKGIGKVVGDAGALVAHANRLIATNEPAITNSIKGFEAFTTALGENSGGIAVVMDDVKQLSARLNRVATKLELTIDRASEYLSSSDGTSLMQDIREAVSAFRSLAVKLESSLGDNADGLTRVAKRSLKEFELFMRDGRRAAKSLDRVLDKIERDPQSLIFGGSSVPEYNTTQ